ncbi:MAG TPA: pilus assembly protein PilM, partial [Gammaproteobacteria bacterium]|nr:pilus assembly protein PilM [Gammaproteobacteria bacterium]
YSEIHYLILAGGATAIQGLGIFLEEKLKVSTMIADPFVNMTLSPKVSVPAIKADAASLLICCGLAMRSFVS